MTIPSTKELPGLSKVWAVANPEISSTFQLRSSGQVITKRGNLFKRREAMPQQKKLPETSNAVTKLGIGGCNTG